MSFRISRRFVLTVCIFMYSLSVMDKISNPNLKPEFRFENTQSQSNINRPSAQLGHVSWVGNMSASVKGTK